MGFYVCDDREKQKELSQGFEICISISVRSKQVSEFSAKFLLVLLKRTLHEACIDQSPSAIENSSRNSFTLVCFRSRKLEDCCLMMSGGFLPDPDLVEL